MARLSLKLLGICLTLAACNGGPAHGAGALPARALAVSRDSSLDVNELRLGVSNLADFASFGSATIGLEWPRGSGRNALFAGGLWIGARVNGETRVSVAEYASEFAAGPLDDSGQPIDPNEVDPIHRVYKIRRGDDAPSNPDWALWPVALGAPSDGAGNPRVLGDQTLWSVCNDAVASKHTLLPGGTAPMGLEVRQTVFGFDRPGPLGRMAFVEYWIFNKGQNTLDSAYVGLWSDPDLGGAGDDLVGCDPELDLGYVYNADDHDDVYGTHPPAVGIMLLKGPASSGGDLRMTGFGRLLKNFLEPNSAADTYGRFLGVRENGSLQTCQGQPAPLEVADDPVMIPPPPDTSFGQGPCVDGSPGDRRFLLSTGPFRFLPGTSRRVVIAIIVGGRDGIGDRLGNIERLRSYARVAREVHDRNFENIGTAAEVDPGDLYLGVRNEPLTFDGTRSTAGSGPAPAYFWSFGDGPGSNANGLTPTHTYQSGGRFKATLHALGGDLPVSCGVKVDIYDPAAEAVAYVDATRAGIFTVRSIRNQGLPALFQGVAWGGRFFGGGLDTGCRWSGSSITGEIGDRPICPGAVHSPQRFKRVSLIHGGSHKAYRYFRRELPSGAEPAVGRGYTYQGFVDTPFRAMADVGTGQVQLEIMFTERQVTDDAGNPVGVQPSTQDGIWLPSTAADGGHEYISIVDLPYSGVEDPTLAQDGVFFAATAPVLYGGRLKLVASQTPQPGMGLEIMWVNTGDPGPGLDVAWGTIGDGTPAFLLSNGDGTSRLFHASVGGFGPSFIDFGIAYPPSAVGLARSAAWADYDGDGLDDLFVTSLNSTNHLLRQAWNPNEGAHELVEVDQPVLAGPGTSRHAAWADVDVDGDLDLFVVNGSMPNQLFRNDGPAGFLPVTPSVLSGRATGIRATWVDFDGDFDPDLHLSNGATPDQLLRNDRGAGFVDVTPAAFASGTGSGVDVAWGDYDGDGDLDVFVVRFGGQHQLIRNDGSAGFVDVTPVSLLGDGTGQRAEWLDFDLDGDLDLGLADFATGFHLIANHGGSFVGVTTTPPTAAGAIGVADYDLDGDLDLHLAGQGADFIARNDLVGGRWIHVTLEGTRSQRQGVGARVRVVSRGATQTRYVTAAGSVPHGATFGVGGAASVDRIEVEWPSGAVSTLTDVPVFSRVTVREDFQPPQRFSIGRAYPSPSAGVTRIDLVVPDGAGSIDLAIHDISGRRVWSRRVTDLLPGTRTVSWDGLDRDGRQLPPGVYFLRAVHATGAATARIVQVR